MKKLEKYQQERIKTVVVIIALVGVYLGYEHYLAEKGIISTVKTAVQGGVCPKPEPVATEPSSVPVCPPTPTCPSCPAEKICAVCEECQVCQEHSTPECTQPGYCRSFCREGNEEFMKTYRKVRNHELKLLAREGQFFTFVRGELVNVGIDRVDLDSCQSVRAERQKCRDFRRKYHKKMDGIAECDRLYNPILRNLEVRFPETCQ